ncbi:MAG: DUF262 domain-containing HNH endonuclease family protein [Pseudomonadota bacterium]
MFPKRKPRLARLEAAGDIDWADDDDGVPPGISSRMYTLRGLLRSSHLFAVPPYQRAYSWQDEQVEKLLDDTLTACEAGEPSYLLGTMVVQKMADDTYLVVDGYQRLMTLTLILSHLRDLNADTPLAARLQALIAPNNQGRLSPRRADQDLVRECVQHPGRLAHLPEKSASIAQRRLAAASKLIGDTLAPPPPAPPTPPEAMIAYANFLCRRITLNVIEADNAVSAGVLFRVLAERGLRMPESALVKSQLLVRAGIPRDEADDLSDRWDKLEDDLGERDFEDFLRLTPQILTGDAGRRRTPDLSYFYDGAFEIEQARRFMRREIWAFADIFLRFNVKEIERLDADPEIKRVMKCLLLYRERHWMAPAIDYLANHPLDTPETLAFMQGLDRLCFLRAMGGLPENRLNARYARILAAHGDMATLAEQGMFGLTDHEHETLMKKLHEPAPVNEHRRRILALRCNAALENGEALVDAGQDATIEHIKPLSDSAYWQNKFPNLKRRREFTHILGNFTIVTLTQNNAAANLSFEEKKGVYFDRRFPMRAITRTLEEVKEWNELAVMRRHDSLIYDLCKDLKITAPGLSF